ncbi:hypothetical protein [Corynebacterium uterequi]|uniref:Uncharacterized protein n=1 Tax=Corynebacterium uterequi TaxID=1072256 RepID=A0A0G3H9N7_9CORY|nr:hypothetical protein [Corynebacterium uterequi]AKK10039.1 hypothetical protein CUTER_00030 [Corynebacterium uterequi]
MGRYRMDYDWLWGKCRDTATVRLRVTGEAARGAVDAFLAALPADDAGVRGRGGWAVRRTLSAPGVVELEIISGGQDVADGIFYGTDAAYEALKPFEVALSWENLEGR